MAAGFVEQAGAAAQRGLMKWITGEERARAAGERHEAIRMAGAFHLHLAAHAGNTTLERVLREAVTRTSLVLMRYGPQEVREAGGCDCHEHRAIAAALKLRDKAAAGRLLLRHLDRLEGQLGFDAPARAAPRLADVLAA